MRKKRLHITLTVELQTECRVHRDPEPHVCEVEGRISAMSPDGWLEFTPHDLADSVAVPSAYIATLRFR